MRSPMFVLTVVIFNVVFMASTCFSDQALQFSLHGARETMLPLGYSSSSVLGLKRNGYLIEVAPGDIEDAKVIPRFSPSSQSEVRGELLREFGKQFEVSGTGNYLVVHPRGKRDIWADQFETLYRSMTHFFRTRGYPMMKPRFPLVGVVFYSQNQYLNYSRRVLNKNANNTYGLYDSVTNRIYLYDATRGQGTKSPEWNTNVETVMHEVAHQTAFNTNIHVRGAAGPAWIAEGIGCLFEARGIYDSFHFKSQRDRLNPVRLRDFKRHVKDDAESVFGSLISTDRPFQRDPVRAYAAAWALTFYLSEREPGKYIEYLKTVAEHEPCVEYSRQDRLEEFTAAFGKDFRMLATRATRFLDGLPEPTVR